VGSAKIPLATEPPAIAAGPSWPMAGAAPLGTPAHYGSRILVGSADFQMHAVSDRGIYLWGFKTGGRVYSSPVPNGDDVYFGSDDGRLYKVDLHSGMLLWEFVTGDRVRSSPALLGNRVFAASYDGFLYAVDTESGQLAWKTPLAKFTRCSPAIADGKIYIGDESGQMLCFDAATGSLVWKVELGGYISTCPLVTAEGVVFASDQGNIAVLDTAGAVKWKKDLKTNVRGNLFATKTQILVPTSGSLMILSRDDGEPDTDVEGVAGGQAFSAVVYRGKLCVTRASMSTNFTSPPRTYGLFGSAFEVWSPGVATGNKPKATKPPKPPK
jgi:outer membrane protein assembly factor BamB